MFLSFISVFSVETQAAIRSNKSNSQAVLVRELDKLQKKIVGLERSIVKKGRHQWSQKRRLMKIRQLLALHRKEKNLSLKRMRHLKKTIRSLEKREYGLQGKIKNKKMAIRKSLAQIYTSFGLKHEDLNQLLESESFQVPRRVVLRRIAKRELKSIEEIKADLDDLNRLTRQIDQEKQYLSFMLNDMKEQESLLKFHKKLQRDVIRRDYQERLSQLDQYRRLKDSESQIAKLIRQFNARKEFKKVTEMEGGISKSMLKGEFTGSKGRLPMPISGKIVSHFGKQLDSKSQLHIFKKGIEILGKKNQVVKAIFSGRVVYAGVLPRYGQVTILDHGSHHYSLCAQLGQLTRRAGDFVRAGDRIGVVDSKGTPIYFEIRYRNVAVNPLQWVSL